MSKLLLCSQDPLLIKELYGPLRDGGIKVDTIEYISDAVRKHMSDRYDSVVLDTRNVGLNAVEAASIMKSTFSETAVFLLGNDESGADNNDGMFIESSAKDIDRFMEQLKGILKNQVSMNN